MIIFMNVFLIRLVFCNINYSPFSKSFIPIISFSFSNNHNLKIVNPAENISLFSGLNYPNPD